MAAPWEMQREQMQQFTAQAREAADVVEDIRQALADLPASGGILTQVLERATELIQQGKVDIQNWGDAWIDIPKRDVYKRQAFFHKLFYKGS